MTSLIGGLVKFCNDWLFLPPPRIALRKYVARLRPYLEGLSVDANHAVHHVLFGGGLEVLEDLWARAELNSFASATELCQAKERHDEVRTSFLSALYWIGKNRDALVNNACHRSKAESVGQQRILGYADLNQVWEECLQEFCKAADNFSIDCHALAAKLAK